MRTVMALLLGGWLLGTLLVAGVAAENFYMIDRLLNSPSNPVFQKDVAQLTPPEARAMLRYLSSELNRYYFQVWGGIEAALGIALWALAVWGLKQRKFVIGFSLMLAAVAGMVLYLAPQIVAVGRSLDFVPREPPPPALARFGLLHAAYTLVDLGKLLVGVWMAIALARLDSGEGGKRRG